MSIHSTPSLALIGAGYWGRNLARRHRQVVREQFRGYQ